MKRSKARCVYCGCDEPLAFTKDHKTPKIRGGTDEETNIQICCWTCNQLKGPLTHTEYLKYRKSLRTLKELEKIQVIYPSPLQIRFIQAFYPGGGNYNSIKQEVKK